MFKRILVPVDLQETQFAQRALSIAVDAAQHHAADLHVLVVIPGFSMPMVANYFPNDAFEKAYRLQHRRLARARGAQQRDDLARLDLEIDAAQHFDGLPSLLEAALEVPEGDDCITHNAAPARDRCSRP